jgi:hypothetical protein
MEQFHSPEFFFFNLIRTLSMTTFNNILIKYSTVTQEPVSLLKGELAYSEASGKLFIGNEAEQAVYIGGEDLVTRVGGLEELVTQLQDLVNTNQSSVMDAIGVIQSRLDDLESFQSTAEGQLTSIQGELDTVDQRIADAKADLEGQIATASGNVSDNLAAAVTSLESQIADAVNTAASELTAATDAQAAVNAALNDQINGVAQDLSDFEGETAAALAGLQTQIDQTSAISIAALEAKDAELENRIDSLDTRMGEVRTLLNDGSPTFESVTITGDLVVQGQTVSVDSEVTTIKDPVITLGQGSNVVDGLGRGIEVQYHDGSALKTGFFGLDTVDGKFKFIPEAEANGNAFTGEAGVVVADIEGKLVNARTVTIEGEVTGAFEFDGSADVNVAVEVVAVVDAAADSVVRRTAAGGIRAVDVEVDGNVVGAGNSITGFVINGGEF